MRTTLPLVVALLGLGCNRGAQPAPVSPAATATPAPAAWAPGAVVDAGPADVSPAAPLALPEGCTEDGAFALHRASRDDRWVASCAALGDERVFVAWRTEPGAADASQVTATLRIAVVRGGAVAWQGTETLRGVPAAEDWSAAPAVRVEGAQGGLFVGLLGSSGEDYRTTTERVVVLRALGEGRYARVWEGDGGREERSMDACFLSGSVTARFADATTLELTRATRARFQTQNIPRDLLARLRRECRDVGPRTERVSLDR